MYVYLQELFDLSSKQTSKIDILWGEIRSSGEEKIKRVGVCVCVGGGGLHVTIFYSPHAPMERVRIPLLPQINITEQYKSQCKRQIIFEKGKAISPSSRERL